MATKAYPEPKLSTETTERLNAANAALATFAGTTQIQRKRGGWYVTWTSYSGTEKHSKRWSTSGSHYPPWYRHWGHGGTSCLALSQLIRWVKGESVLPISSWRYWTSETVFLARHRGVELVALISEAGWPSEVSCVRCGKSIDRAGDWWSLDGVDGPTCSMHDCTTNQTAHRGNEGE